MVTHHSAVRPRWAARISLVGATMMVAVGAACAPQLENDGGALAPMVAANGAGTVIAEQPAVACSTFCQQLNQLQVVVAEAGAWLLNDVGYVDRPLQEGASATHAAVGTYTLDENSATVTAYKFSDDSQAARFAEEYIAKHGTPDHQGPAYQDDRRRPFGSRLDFDRVSADIVLWYGQHGNLFILETPPGMGNDFYLSFEW